jgi:hypothetical protein
MVRISYRVQRIVPLWSKPVTSRTLLAKSSMALSCPGCQIEVGKKAIGLLGEIKMVGSAEEKRLESR